MPKLQLSFHTSFALKRKTSSKFSKLLLRKRLADTTEGLMARTSLGNQKVGPMSWATGVVSGNYLSPEGKFSKKMST